MRNFIKRSNETFMNSKMKLARLCPITETTMHFEDVYVLHTIYAVHFERNTAFRIICEYIIFSEIKIGPVLILSGNE